MPVAGAVHSIKIIPSGGCKGDTVPTAVERWYNFPEFGRYLGNVGQDRPGRDEDDHPAEAGRLSVLVVEQNATNALQVSDRV